jgi:hypothetical protein
MPLAVLMIVILCAPALLTEASSDNAIARQSRLNAARRAKALTAEQTSRIVNRNLDPYCREYSCDRVRDGYREQHDMSASISRLGELIRKRRAAENQDLHLGVSHGDYAPLKSSKQRLAKEGKQVT